MMINEQKSQAVLRRRQLPRTREEERQRWISNLRIEWGDRVHLCEMYKLPDGSVVKGELDFKQFDKDAHFCNTRTKLPTETLFEVDDLDHKEAVRVICEVCLALMKNKIHFVVFYAEGQRSPHIRIYDFGELEELNDFEHEQAQLEFWKKTAPLLWGRGDRGVWSRNHLVQLEFCPHWRTGTMFDLLFEYLPDDLDKDEVQLKFEDFLGCNR